MKIETSKEMPLCFQPPQNTSEALAQFLEMYNNEANWINSLQRENSSMKEEKDHLVEALRLQSEDYQVCKEHHEKILKEVEEKVKKLEKKVEEQEEEMISTRALLAQSKKENFALHAKFKEQLRTVEAYKRFHEQLNSAIPKVTSFSYNP